MNEWRDHVTIEELAGISTIKDAYLKLDKEICMACDFWMSYDKKCDLMEKIGNAFDESFTASKDTKAKVTVLKGYNPETVMKKLQELVGENALRYKDGLKAPLESYTFNSQHPYMDIVISYGENKNIVVIRYTPPGLPEKTKFSYVITVA